MVNVAHHRHDGCARQQLGILLQHFVFGECLGVIQRSHDSFVAHLFHQNHGGVLIQWLVDGDHLAQLHQVLDHLGGFHGHFVGQLGHRNRLGDVHFKNTRFDDLRWCVVITITVIGATSTTWACPPVGRTPCTCARVSTCRDAFFLGGVTRPTAGEFCRFDFFASA